MRFRPCIDIHNGKVKQIVGGSLKDKGDRADTNYESAYGAAYYAAMYKRDRLTGGHIILLNPASSEYYEATREQAIRALKEYPGGMQIGGGITAENAGEYLTAGASHVVVTSYVFKDGKIHWENLERLTDAVGREHIVLDLSCKKRPGDGYYIVTDRWQKFTDVKLNEKVLDTLAEYCDEFLVHGVDVEGKAKGAPEDLLRLLSRHERRTITYAGGIGSMEDLETFRRVSEGRLDFTIGSALDLFGGKIPYAELVNYL